MSSTGSKTHRIITKIHRVCAALFLVAIVPAMIVSAQGKAESPFVYLPLPFLFALTITGTYQLLAPWLRRRRAARHTPPSA